MRNLLGRGNGKLGEAIHHWSIPAVDTCPGRTRLCESVCYARHGHFHLHFVQDRLQENLDASLRTDFVKGMVAEIKRRGVHTLRIHVAGDFYSPEYAAKWIKIARKSPRCTHYTYTRSWRLPEFSEVLQEMAELKNFRLWYSLDAETGTPSHVPEGVQLAYLQREATDDPEDAQVVFRVRPLRQTQRIRIGLSVICPTETGQPGAKAQTCTSCGRCYR